MVRVVILVRVSTDKQDYQRQINELTDYCNKVNWEVVKIFSNKISGVTNLEGREEIISLIQYVRANYIKRVVCLEISRAQNRHFCARVTGDAYGDVGLEVVNMGLGKRKARIFWVCALLLICLAARSAILPGVPFYPECRSTRSAAPPPAGQGTKGQETKSRGTKAGERRAWERRAGGFTGGRG